MAEQDPVPDIDEEDNPNYKPPAKKELGEILKADDDDESLRKYKEALLGAGASGDVIIIDANKKNVIVEKLALCPDDRDEMLLDLSVNLKEIEKKKFIIKEGCQYKVKIYFYVQRDIVQGLKYIQKTYRAGIKVDTKKLMVGSYGPKKELQSYIQPQFEEAPSGMMSRGDYKIESLFTDDDGNEYLKWVWHLAIKKDWE
ncbi:rho GDP-dissociation inhibitor 1-like [Gigantopelta aegis]|uniref:rho GDP-dissociation inhibitor 1-like n=1 Tax=Gigantopelta aegis TaxID=1735272 RepID=UPI001B88E513|nr:rho GDP-dissociation inhibitor 1-like [Gigantopelta aegis]XP_041363677.1 rho GDP-dissociation inhibitor 1-like [Gigantopelta aegis]